MGLENLNFVMKPLYWGIVGAVALILLIVIISVCVKKSKKKKNGNSSAEQKRIDANMKAIADEKEKAAAKRAVMEKAEAQHQAAIRKEVFAKLDAQREEAEKEEAAAKAAEEAETKKAAKKSKKAAKAEEPAKEEVAVAEEPVKEAPAKKAKKSPAKKAEKVEEPATEEAKAEEVKEAPAKKAKKAPAKKAEKVEEPVTEEAKAEEAKEEAPKKAKKAPAKKAEAKEEPAKTETALYDELKDAKEEDDVWYDENETDKLARYAGKWSIFHILTDDNSEDDMYFFELRASNGEKLLSSEEYTSYAGALRGIDTHKNNILKGNFRITLSKKGDYIFKLLSGNGQLLCTGENYPTRVRCESAIKSTKRFARTAIVDENVQDYVLKVPAEDDSVVEPVAEGYNGKWLISNREDEDGEKVYFFELFANNGEKLLSSEEYTTYIGAVNGIQTHKMNIAKGNFRISLTKRGDYIYKLLNGNGQLLCLGEHYKSKARCQSAVESVKRFAENSPVLTDSEQLKD